MKPINIERLLDIGIALSKEKNSDKLFELILTAAMDITHCDAGTLYRKEGSALTFQIMFTRSRNIKRGGSYEPINLPPVPLSLGNVSSFTALKGALINIEDVYKSDSFDFSGPKEYDALTGYLTKSLLVVPMEDEDGICIGVLQLINALDDEGKVISFNKGYEQVISSLASQTAICRRNVDHGLEVQELLDSLVQVMSTAIDSITPYNANHTRNMVLYGERFMDYLEDATNSWRFSKQTRRQFLMSVWLHDAGKITVPLAIMDKESRLGTALKGILDRFHIVRLLDKLAFAEGRLSEDDYIELTNERNKDENLIKISNTAGFIPNETLSEIRMIAEKTFTDEKGAVHSLLNEAELEDLMIQKGTLTDEERVLMENHVVMTDKMLKEVHFPRNYSDVPEWAASHHEFINGSGYPKGLRDGQISREVRLLTILDIFDALTAKDRPYKNGMPPDRALHIMFTMTEEGKLDAEILALFAESRAWEEKNP